MESEALEQLSLTQMSAAIRDRSVSVQALVSAHLARIGALDETYNAVLLENPDALAIAAALDTELAAGQWRGRLHGVPILVKDNLDSGDKMPTTGGSLALAGTFASEDATVLRRLRDAGAVLLGKTNLSEWANFRSTRSSSGWSSAGGQTRNAHDALRTPGGSSSGSGVAVALNYCAGAIGTETDGSIVGPASMNGVVGIKPTVGLVSRAGIIPISASQDTAGPLTRCVSDGALLLDAIVGKDARDPSTRDADSHRSGFFDGLNGLKANELRLGIAKEYTGYHERADSLFAVAVAALRAAGATIVDDVSVGDPDLIRPSERLVMEYEFKAGLNAYLATRTSGSVPKDLDAIIRFNQQNADSVMPHFAQEIHLRAQARGNLDDDAYLSARAASLELAGAKGIDLSLRTHGLDALIAPTSTPAWLIDWIGGDNRRGGASCGPAVAGYPHVSVPMGFVEHLPVGLSVFAGAYQDMKVLQIAHLFEQIRGPL